MHLVALCCCMSPPLVSCPVVSLVIHWRFHFAGSMSSLVNVSKWQPWKKNLLHCLWLSDSFNTNRVARFTFSHAKHTKRSTVAAVVDNRLLLKETRWTILFNSQCQACMKEEGGRRRNEGIHRSRKRMKDRGRGRPLVLVCEEKFIFYRELDTVSICVSDTVPDLDENSTH